MAATVYEIIDVQLLFGQEVLNVFHFVDPAGSTDEAGLVAAYLASVVPLVKVLQIPELTHVGIKHRKVFPTASLMTEDLISPAIAGTHAGDPSASAYAYSFKFQPGVTVVLAGGFTGHLKRSGARLAGVTDALINGNAITDGTFIANAAAWSEELMSPGAGPFVLCVASFLDGARARQTTVQSYSIITSISAPSPSTQNSRKVLRGRVF